MQQPTDADRSEITLARAPGWVRAIVVLGALAVTSIVAVLMAEGGLRLALNSSDFLYATMAEDPELGHHIAPHSTGHDGWGYRNQKVPPQARIVAIGDSNTYGVSAPRDGSWPHHLTGLLGEPVYNMGMGGYGPLQYLRLAQTRGKELKPQVMVFGLYFGNDLRDAYFAAHTMPYWHSWRISSGSQGGNGEAPFQFHEPTRRFAALRDWLSRNSVLYSVLRETALKPLASRERDQMVKQSPPDVRWAWNDPQAPDVFTVFTSDVRLSAQDLGDTHVREGMQLTRRALTEIKAETQQQGVKMLVALIPTKERVYCGYIQAQPRERPKAFDTLCAAEAQVKSEVVRHLEGQRIDYVDLLPALEAGVAAHVQMYPREADGHGVSSGYMVMARAIADAVKRLDAKP